MWRRLLCMCGWHRYRDSEEQLLDQWERWLHDHVDELHFAYLGKYVAVLHGVVVDSDIDSVSLAARVYARYGYQPIFMPYIGESRVYSMSSGVS